MEIAALLSPYTYSAFMDSIWGRSCLYVQGDREKFASLLPWPELNRILAQHRLTSPRIRLVKDGVYLPDSNFIGNVPTRRGLFVPQVMPAELNEKLRDGYTLVINQIDEMFMPITAVAQTLEYVFHERVLINAYAVWGESHGFKVHTDDHDVFILQVAGRKSWRVFGLSDPSNHDESTPAQVMWQGTLEDGDLLYIPRGWWHEAHAENEPSLHLTCGIQNRNGLNLLTWVQEKLQSNELFLSDLPRFAPCNDQLAHIAKLRDEICKQFNESVLSRFFDNYDCVAASRPHVSLPWAAIPGSLPDDDTVPILFLLERPTKLSTTTDNQHCELVGNGRRWRFPIVYTPVLQKFLVHRVCSVMDILSTEPEGGNRDSIRNIVSTLLFHGLVAISDRYQK